MSDGLRWLAIASMYRGEDPVMSLLLTVLGVVVTAFVRPEHTTSALPLQHLHTAYGVVVPIALALALAHPPLRDAAVAIAAALALLVAVLSALAWFHTPHVDLADLELGRAVRRAARRQWTVDLDGQIRSMQRRREPPEA